MQRPARDNEARGTKDTFFKGTSSVVVAPNGDIFVVDGHGLLHCMSPEIGPKPKFRKLVAMSAPEGIADKNCSPRAFQLLTHMRHEVEFADRDVMERPREITPA